MAWKFNIFTGTFDIAGSSSSALPATPITGILTGGLLYAISAGYMLEKVVVRESGGSDISIRLGTAAGLDDIAPDQTITASLYNDITLDKPPVTGGFNVFVSKTGGGAFLPSVLTFYILLRKVF